MTKKRHAKLVRAFTTRVYEHSKKDGMCSMSGHSIRQAVANAKKGDPITVDGKQLTRLEWWEMVEDVVTNVFGLKIKEYR